MKIKDVAELKAKDTAVIEGTVVWVGEPKEFPGQDGGTFTSTKISIKDNTGSIYCSTSKTPPAKGAHIEARGSVNVWKKRDGTVQRDLRIKELTAKKKETKTETEQMTKGDWAEKDKLIAKQAITKAVCGMFGFSAPLADDSVENFETQIIGIMEQIEAKFLFPKGKVPKSDIEPSPTKPCEPEDIPDEEPPEDHDEQF